MFLPSPWSSLAPNGHVLATLETISPMAAHFISCREVRHYKIHQRLHTKTPIQPEVFFHTKRIDACWVSV